MESEIIGNIKIGGGNRVVDQVSGDGMCERGDWSRWSGRREESKEARE